MDSSACTAIRHTTQPFHHFLVDNRVIISSSLFAALAFGFLTDGRPTNKWSSGADTLGICGLVLTIVGLLIRTWAAGVLNKGRGLAMLGPFSLCRHPLYLGSFAMMLGIAMIFGNVLHWSIVIVVLCVIYQATIRREESRLEERYGSAWRCYTSMTPRLIPLRMNFEPAPWMFSLWMRNREYRAVLATLAGLAILEWVPLV